MMPTPVQDDDFSRLFRELKKEPGWGTESESLTLPPEPIADKPSQSGVTIAATDLRPNSFYLGPNFKSAAEVRAVDDAFLRSVNGSYEDIAYRVRQFLLAGENWGRGDINSRRYRVSWSDDPEDQEKGPACCHFGGCRFTQGEEGFPTTFKVANVETGVTIKLNDMVWHLIAAHHFLEKAPGYGFTAQTFYENFMKDD